MKYNYYEITNLEQLKALGDPLRMKIVWHLLEEPLTGKMLGSKLDIPASKVHYHLKELERVGLIYVTHTEEKNGIMQKFYQPIAAKVTISDDLIPYISEAGDGLKENLLQQLDFTKKTISRTSEELLTISDEKEKIYFNTYVSLYLNVEEAAKITEKLNELMRLIKKVEQRNDSGDKSGKLHLFSSVIVPTTEDANVFKDIPHNETLGIGEKKND